MDSDGIRLLIILLFFVLLRAFFTAFEHIIIEVNDSKVKELAENDPKYLRLSKLITNPSRMMTACSTHKVVSTLCIGVTFLFFLIENFQAQGFEIFLCGIGAVFACSIFILAFTDIIPRRFVDGKPSESAALFALPFINVLIIVMFPFSCIINAISFVFSKIFGLSTQTKADVVTEEEILMMVEAGNETGVIEESQCEMINNIFEFGDVKVSEIMTHRTDIIAIDITDKISDIIYLAINKGFSRMPVYDGSVDKIIGIVYVKDFLCLVGCENSEDFCIRDFMREALYIPATNKCDEVFEVMTKKKMQMAVVIDEYGGTAGLVTMEDILEEIVGNIQDEYDEEEQEIYQISEGIYAISGAAPPDDVFRTLHVKLPEQDEREYDTMGALVVELLGRIPGENESPSVMYENIEFTVMLVEDNWISKIKAVVKEQEVSGPSEEKR